MRKIQLVFAVSLLACGPGQDEADGGGGSIDANGGVEDAPVNDVDASNAVDAAPRPDGIEGCDPQSFTLEQAPPPEVMLVIDRSGSMNEAGSAAGVTRWDELNAAVDFVATQFDDSIRLGLLMYPSGGECSTSGPQVGVGAANAGAVLFNLANATPSGGTPTAAALVNAASSLRDLGNPSSPDFIILATDGGPNCNYFKDPNPSCSCSYASSPEYCCTAFPSSCVFGNACLDDSETVDTITALRTTDNIETFVIGLEGTSEYVSLLDAMAVAGGRPQGAATEYYAAANQAELQAALEAIAVSIISCVIDLSETPQAPDDVRVWIDGQEVSRDPTQMNGWDYTSSANDQVELHGAACDTLRDGSSHTLTATFGCIVE